MDKGRCSLTLEITRHHHYEARSGGINKQNDTGPCLASKRTAYKCTLMSFQMCTVPKCL